MDDKTRNQISKYIRENGITSSLYAKVFAYLYFNDSNKGYLYDSANDTWRKDGEAVSEMEILQLIPPVYKKIKDTIDEEWGRSIFSSLISAHIIRKIYDELYDMEKMDKINDMLDIAKRLMTVIEEDGVEWIGDENEDLEPPEIVIETPPYEDEDEEEPF